MDRLDTWLNAKRGWRRLALIGAALYPPTFLVGFYSWLCLGLVAGTASGGPTQSALVICAVLAVPAAVGLGSIGARIRDRQARCPGGKKALGPFLAWRMAALFWAMFASSLSATLVAGQAESSASHRVLAGLQLVFALAVIALGVEILRHRRRFAGARTE